MGISTSIELVRIVEATGGRFEVEGDRLAVAPKSAAAPVREELRQHKQEIIDLLTCRSQMPDGVLLISWAPRDPPVCLSPCEVVVNVPKFISTTLRQLDACLRGETWLSGHWGLQGLLDRLTACGCHGALDNPRKTGQ